MESNSIPDFAPRISARKCRESDGKTWVEADASEYKILRLMSNLIRNDPDPVSVVKMVQEANPDWTDWKTKL